LTVKASVLNQDTLLLVQVSFTLLTTALLVSAALYQDALLAQRLWALGNLVACLGLAVGGVTSLPLAVHAVASYGLMALGLGLVLQGLRIFCRQEMSWRWLAGITIAALVPPAYYTYIAPSLHARLIVTGLYFGLLNWVCAGTLLRHSKGRTILACVMGFAVLGLVLIVRGLYLLARPAAGDEINDVVMNGSLFIIPLAQVGITFGLILMVARRHAERLRLLTTLDTLTGALNRSALEVQGQRIIQRARQGHRAVAVVMIDADHFKDINDTWGHPTGDAVLRHLTTVLSAQMRPVDVVARYGGEEFVLVFDGLNLGGAMSVAERLRRTIEQETLTIDAHAIRYTVSMGVASSDEHGHELQKLISKADSALYQAKKAGRNCVLAA
jgi:diguanylate cyclase (GGDEF)-like protein